MEQCPLCGFFSPSFQLLVSHLRLVHSTDSAFRVSCNIGECSQEFRSFSAFNSHVYRWHRAAVGLEHEIAEDTFASCNSPSPASHQDIISAANLSMSDFDEYSDQDLDEKNVHQRAFDDASYRKINAEFIMKLSEGRQLSQAALDDVIKGCRAICEQTLGTVKEIVSVALSDIGIAVPGLTDMLATIPDPFDGLESQYMREKFYKQHFNYVVSLFDCTCVDLVIMHYGLIYKRHIIILFGSCPYTCLQLRGVESSKNVGGQITTNHEECA